MNAPSPHHFPAQMPVHHNIGQFNQGNQAHQMMSGIPDPYMQGQANLLDPQLAQWTFKKGQNDTWADVDPQQQHVLLEELQLELTKTQKRNIPVRRTLNEIPSDSARSTIDRLVDDENQELWKYNYTLQWKIVGVDLEWKSLNRKYRQLRTINVLLKTEKRPFSQMPQVLNSIPGGSLDFTDPLDYNRPAIRQHDQPIRPHLPAQNGGPAFNGPRNQNVNFVPSYDDSFAPIPGRNPSQGANQMHGGRPEPLPPIQNVQPKVMHGPKDGPPPPPLHNTLKQPNTQPQPQPTFSQAKPVKGLSGLAQGNPAGSTPGIVKLPNTIGKQNGPGVMPKKNGAISSRIIGGFHDSDSDSDDHSFSAVSTEDGIYNVTRGRSSSLNRGRSSAQSRGRSLHRSLSRGGVSKPYQETTSHVKSRSPLDPPPIGPHGSKSSPKTSGNMPPNINIHVNTSNIPTENDKDRRQDRGHNGHRTRDHGVERDRARARSTERYEHIRESKRRVNSRSPSMVPKQGFHKGTSSPMSQSFFSDYGSDTVYSANGSSSDSFDDGSVFSDDMGQRHKGRRSRGSLYGNSSSEEIYQDHKPRTQRRHSTRANDYPRNPRKGSRHYLQRPVIHHTDVDDQYYDANPFDATRYPPRRSNTYDQYPQYAPKGLLSDSRDSFDMSDIGDIVEATVEALHAKKANAYDHIQQSRRPALRRTQTSRSPRHREEPDPWVNPRCRW